MNEKNPEEEQSKNQALEMGKDFAKEEGKKNVIKLIMKNPKVAAIVFIVIIVIMLVFGGVIFLALALKEIDSDKKDTATEAKNAAFGSSALIAYAADSNPIDDSSSVTSNGTKIFIGDSRTVGMYYSIYGGNETDGIQTKASDGTVWSAETSQNLDWMKDTGIPNVQNEITQGSNIIILMGVNDLYNDSRYIETINEKANEWKDLGANTYFVSVNPVDDTKAASKGYSQKTNTVEDFNNKIKAGLNENVHYIDTYSQIKSSFSTTDGLHYNKETYKNIYDLIVKAVGENSGTNAPQQNEEIEQVNAAPILQIDGNKYKIVYGDKTGREAIEEALDDNGFPFEKFTEDQLQVIYKSLKAEWATIYPNLGDKIDNYDEDNEYMQGKITFVREFRKESNSTTSDSIELTYLPYEEFESQLQSSKTKGDTEILKYFTIDQNGKARVAGWSSKEVKYTFDGNIPDDIKGYHNDSKIINLTETAIDYKSMIGIHAEPFELLLTLLIYTDDEEFVSDLADLAFDDETKLIITIYENTTETVTTEVERTQRNTETTKAVDYTKIITKRIKKQKTTGGLFGPLLDAINALEEYVEKTEVQRDTEEIYRDVENLDYYITTNRTDISNSYSVALSKVNSWIAEIDNHYNYNPKLGEKTDLGLGTATDLTNTILENIGTNDADVQNYINRTNSRSLLKTVQCEVTNAIKATKITGSIGLTENTQTVNEYKFEKQELTSNKGKVGERFEEVYNDHQKAQAQFDCIDSWIFESLEDEEATVDYISILKYLLYVCAGQDYNVYEEDIEEILNFLDDQTFTFISDSVRSNGTGYWWPIGSNSEQENQTGFAVAEEKPALGKTAISRAGYTGTVYGFRTPDGSHEYHGGTAIDVAGGGQTNKWNVISIGNGTVTEVVKTVRENIRNKSIPLRKLCYSRLWRNNS